MLVTRWSVKGRVGVCAAAAVGVLRLGLWWCADRTPTSRSHRHSLLRHCVSMSGEGQTRVQLPLHSLVRLLSATFTITYLLLFPPPSRPPTAHPHEFTIHTIFCSPSHDIHLLASHPAHVIQVTPESHPRDCRLRSHLTLPSNHRHRAMRTEWWL